MSDTPEYFKELLNAGHLRLVDHMGTDISISRNARVSYDAEWRAGEDKGSDKRLLGYLMRNGHNTPFESVVVTFDVKAPIFVFRQWHRHRTQSYNELSARYRPLPAEWYKPEPWVVGTQSKHNKQMRHVLTEMDWVNTYSEEERVSHIETASYIDVTNKRAYEAYQLMLDQKIPRELARSVLPVGMYSHMFATMNLHNAFNFIRERSFNHSQYEIRVYSHAMFEALYLIAPVACEHFIATLGEGYEELQQVWNTINSR